MWCSPLKDYLKYIYIYAFLLNVTIHIKADIIFIIYIQIFSHISTIYESYTD